MIKLMLGNMAVARGLYEAGADVVSSYPGTPSTEITEFAAKYSEMHTEWAPNEKVACETAIGASIAGARAFCAMKHVGLNVAADPLFTASYSGVSGGLVIGVADDPGMHSSQNEQDSRHYAIASKVPLLEPSDSAECKDYTKAAFDLSEQFDTPVILRLTTRIAHSQSVVEEGERVPHNIGQYVKDSKKYVMMPANARPRHVFVEERTERLKEYAEVCPLNSMELNSTDIGIISSGIACRYAKEALGSRASYLKLGLINPLPEKLIRDFAARVKKLYVIEELDDIIENHCRRLGLKPIGKEFFTYIGEYSTAYLKEKILGEKDDHIDYPENIPVRTPIMCAGCPHRGLFYVLKKLGVMVSGDIGCYTLGAVAPLNAVDTTICMGASVSGLHGFNKARKGEYEHKAVAVIGDSTFIHSGITGLINIAYNASNSTVIILDNSITGMTGHQNNPANGFNIKGEPATAVDLEALCRAVGIDRVRVVDPNDLAETEAAVREELAADEPSVIITRRPCALLKSVKHGAAVTVDSEKCRLCKMCMKIGCPAVSMSTGKVRIDNTLCVGCGLCGQMCKFGAIN